MDSFSRNSFQYIDWSTQKEEIIFPLECSGSRLIINCATSKELNSLSTVLPSQQPQDSHLSVSLPLFLQHESEAKTSTNNKSSNNSDSCTKNNIYGDVSGFARKNSALENFFIADGVGHSSDVSDRSTTTINSNFFLSVNSRRFANPAFSFSPSVASSSGTMSILPSTQQVTLHTDRKTPPEEHIYVLGTMEGRRNFFVDCDYLAKHMSKSMIVNELIVAMLIALNYSDSLFSIALVLPDVIQNVQDLDESLFVCFMGLIMNLCCAADHAVVSQIAASLIKLILHLTNDITENILLPLVMSMQVSFWSSPRAVAAALLGICASKESIVQKSGMTVHQWFDCFTVLARDKSDFVRRVAVLSLHQWVNVARVHQVDLAKMPLLLVNDFLASSESSVVRRLCVAQFVFLAEKMGKKATAQYLQIPFIALCSDSTLLVRYIAAKQFGRFVAFCPSPDDFLNVFIALCADENKDIRAAAIEQLDLFVSNVLLKESLCKICVTAVSLAKDKEPVVRMAVANFLYLFFSPSFIEVCTAEQLRVIFELLIDEECIVGQCATRNLEKVAASFSKYQSFLANSNGFINANIITTVPASFYLTEGGKCNNNNISFADTTNDYKRSAGKDIPCDVSCVMSNTDFLILSLQQELNEQPNQLQCETGENVDNEKKQKDRQLQEQQLHLHKKQMEGITFALDSLFEYLNILSQSKNWRIRETLVVVVRHFTIAFSRERFGPLTYIVRLLLRDSVNAVRVSAVDTLRVVAFAYGPEWAAPVAFDLLQNEFASIAEQSYVWRAMAIRCLSATLSVVCGLSPMDLRRQELLQRWVRLVEFFSADGVSNVRLTLAKSMVEFWPLYAACGVQHGAAVRGCVERLRRDVDVDVSRVAAELDMSSMRV